MRWNARVKTEGTPPLLDGLVRDPEGVESRIQELARKYHCNAELWWDRFSYAARVYVKGKADDVDRFLAELESPDVRQEVTTEEKKHHPEITDPEQAQ